MTPNTPDRSAGSAAGPSPTSDASGNRPDRPSTEHPADPNNEPAPGSGQLRKPGDRYDQPGQGADLTPDSQHAGAMRIGAVRTDAASTGSVPADAARAYGEPAEDATTSDLHLPSPATGARHSDAPLSGLSAQDAAETAGRPIAPDAPTHRGPAAP